ncbi:MAG TPA: CxxxxCH/CxxCH domain-containing protein, partial [Myxococcota bacterium]|nr:CxxxxCH/CxxCH domain-containing protein [Myxococcota bacterium]HQK49763.1 CxxxxCH/CxxCH domain-containing protein [Myxococcota bacterium]
MSLRAGGLLILAMLLACLGCSEGRSPGSRDSIPGTGELGGPDGEVLRCAGCHGTEAPWAPPPDTRGHQDGTYRGVGAHLAHLDASLGRKVACGECHVVPTTVDAAGHLDSPLPAEVTVSGVGTTDGLDPVVEADGDQAQALVTCRNVYCHGASLDGGTRTSPSWNSDEPGRFRQCGACHGMPPARIRSGAAHPTSEACASCHGEVVAPDGTFRNASLHVNGVVEVVAGGACNSCHGNATNAAP